MLYFFDKIRAGTCRHQPDAEAVMATGKGEILENMKFRKGEGGGRPTGQMRTGYFVQIMKEKRR